MIKRDKRETEQKTVDQLLDILLDQYAGESSLCKSVLTDAIVEQMIKTEFELAVAYETVSTLNDWPEEEGYGSSDRAWDLRNIQTAIDHNRRFLKAEQELVTINKLDDLPKVDDTLKYMAMNRTIQQHLIREEA
jgi:hypothetical protein